MVCSGTFSSSVPFRTSGQDFGSTSGISDSSTVPGSARASGLDRNGEDRNGDERNGDERKGDERNGDERNGDERNGACWSDSPVLRTTLGFRLERDALVAGGLGRAVDAERERRLERVAAGELHDRGSCRGRCTTRRSAATPLGRSRCRSGR